MVNMAMESYTYAREELSYPKLLSHIWLALEGRAQDAIREWLP